ncbi:Uncharacterized protein APZ42_025622 [Daphnia magna]|uniref:Uncharacterized protein n=1 Tax=Daphnia magna TaxID=35525 RepID=A0A164SWW3_9CRUS|nr:Uncharacterized protein APZ42_025622 [Daphnia magna]
MFLLAPTQFHLITQPRPSGSCWYIKQRECQLLEQPLPRARVLPAGNDLGHINYVFGSMSMEIISMHHVTISLPCCALEKFFST